MQPSRFSHPVMRGVGAALIALVGLLGACETRMPTATDIAGMDAASAERGTAAIGFPSIASVVWFVDGVASTAVAAKLIPRDSIASVEVRKSSGSGRISITTKRGQGEGMVVSGTVPPIADSSPGVSKVSVTGVRTKPWSVAGEAQPMVLIDGVKSNAAVLAKLDRSRIQKVEVIKGADAIVRYGNDAKNGVILITTMSAEGGE